MLRYAFAARPAPPRPADASTFEHLSYGSARVATTVVATGAGALLRNHLEETALPSGLLLAFITTKKLD